MPPRNRTSTMQAEEALARRIALEREQRGWSPAGLASRLTRIGCPMTQSGIWKIENGEPRRRITFDEAVAFAEVFEISLADLSTDPQVERERAAAVAARQVWDEVDAIEEGGRALRSSLRRLDEMLEGPDGDEIAGAVRFHLYRWLDGARMRVGQDKPEPEEVDDFFYRARYLAKATKAQVGSDGQHQEA